jgi:hypothetical protein
MMSAMRHRTTIGPPIAEGPRGLTCSGDPNERGKIAIARQTRIRTILCTPLLPATTHERTKEGTIKAIAVQAPDERSRNVGAVRAGTTQWVRMRLRSRPIRVLRRIGMTMGAVSGAAGKTLRLNKRTARETVPNYEATGWHIRTLRCQAHALRPGMNIAHPLAIAAAGPRLPRSS